MKINKSILLYLILLMISIALISFISLKPKKIFQYRMRNKCYSYLYSRDYINDSIFMESYSNEAIKNIVINDTFKISKNGWCYLLDGQYETLFSKELFNNKKISRQYFNKIKDSTYALYKGSHIAYEPLYKSKYNNREVWIYYYYLWGERTTIKNYYPNLIYFDIQYGIVKKLDHECGTSIMQIIK
jgi:hypothetical protein